MYVVAERWKVKDVNGQLRKEGERVELSEKDAARLLKTGVIRDVPHNANDDTEPGVNGSEESREDGRGGEDKDDGWNPDEEINDADDISAAGGDIPGAEDLGGDGDAPEKPKGRHKK